MGITLIVSQCRKAQSTNKHPIPGQVDLGSIRKVQAEESEPVSKTPMVSTALQFLPWFPR